MDITTIRVTKKTKKRLREFESHHRQTDEEILELLLTHCSESMKQKNFEIGKEVQDG